MILEVNHRTVTSAAELTAALRQSGSPALLLAIDTRKSRLEGIEGLLRLKQMANTIVQHRWQRVVAA